MTASSWHRWPSSSLRGADAASKVLSHINSLYTVYYSIVLFDAERCVVAVSRDDQAHLVGTLVEESWVGKSPAKPAAERLQRQRVA